MTNYSVTEKDINDLLDSSEYQEFVVWDKDFILCAKLPNGWTMVGRAACVDPENFDINIGRAIARTDLFNQLWPLLGYQMQLKLVEDKAKS